MVAVIVMTAGAAAQTTGTYVITVSGTSFTAVKGSTTIRSHTAIQTVINAIKTDAGGLPCAIQFGNGIDTLNINTQNITFDGGTDGTDWGIITLSGKLMSSDLSSNDSGAIYLTNSASIKSVAEISFYANTSNTSYYGIYNASTGMVTIGGGTVSTTAYFAGNSYGIYNASTGTVTISGGAISAYARPYATFYGTSYGIYNASAGTVTISGGAISASGSYSYGIYNISMGMVTINSGTVSASGDYSYGIYNVSTGSVTVNSGTVSASGFDSYGVYNVSTGSVAVNGGTVSAYTSASTPANSNANSCSYGIYNVLGEVIVSGGSVSSVRSSSTSGSSSILRSSYGIYNASGEVRISGGSVSSARSSSFGGSSSDPLLSYGIYNTSTGVVTVSGGEVSSSISSSDDRRAIFAFCYGIYNTSAGVVTISDGTVSSNISTSIGPGSGNTTSSYGIYTVSTGVVTVSGGEVSSSTTTSEGATPLSYGIYIESGEVTISDVMVSAFSYYSSSSLRNNSYGIHNGSGTVRISDVKISASCGISNESGTVTISDAAVSASFTGVRNDSGNVTIRGGTVSSLPSNYISYSYGIYNESGQITINEVAVNVYDSSSIGCRCYGIWNVSGELTIIGGTVSSFGAEESIGVLNGFYYDDSGAGKMTISGVKISSSTIGSYIRKSSYGIFNTGMLTINKGTVSSSASVYSNGTFYGVSYGINNSAMGEVTINEVAVSSSTPGSEGISNYGKVTINGGTVSSSSVGIMNGNEGEITMNEVAVSSDTTRIFNYGKVTINGGTISSSGNTSVVDIYVGKGTTVLGGSPNITRRIYLADTSSKVSVSASGDNVFAPGNKTYKLDLMGFDIGSVAVLGGAEFLSNFILDITSSELRYRNYKLVVGGSDLIVSAHNVSFDFDGGSGTLQGTVWVSPGDTLSKAQKPDAGSKIGYTNDGKWYTRAGTPPDYTYTEFVFGNGGTQITSDIMLYVKWTPIQYTITYDLDGGTVSSANPASYTVETPDFTLNNPTKTGYTFWGWTWETQTTVTIEKGSTGDKTYTAKWSLDGYAVTFSAGANGNLKARSKFYGLDIYPDFWCPYGDSVVFTAIPDSGYKVGGWTVDGVPVADTGNTYTLIVSADATVAVSFAKTVSVLSYAVTFNVGANGVLTATVDGSAITTGALVQYGTTVIFTATPNEDYEVSGWTLNGTAVVGNVTNTYTLTGVSAETTVAVSFTRTISVLTPDRVIPQPKPNEEATVIAPITVLSGEFTAGPNPVAKQSGSVNFYRQGKRVSNSELRIYDATGNVISKVKISDKALNSQARRQVGSWNLTDKNGRQVSEGTYLVRGVVKTLDGKSEKVSVILGVR